MNGAKEDGSVAQQDGVPAEWGLRLAEAERQHWELLALQQEREEMATSIVSLKTQVTQLLADKSELENHRDRLLAQLDAAQCKEKDLLQQLHQGKDAQKSESGMLVFRPLWIQNKSLI